MPLKFYPSSGRRENKTMEILCMHQCVPNISYAEIGRKVGRTRERVRQVLGNRNMPRNKCKYCGMALADIAKTKMEAKVTSITKVCIRCRPWRALEKYIASHTLFTCIECGIQFYNLNSQLKRRYKIGRPPPQWCSKRCYGKQLARMSVLKRFDLLLKLS